MHKSLAVIDSGDPVVAKHLLASAGRQRLAGGLAALAALAGGLAVPARADTVAPLAGASAGYGVRVLGGTMVASGAAGDERAGGDFSLPVAVDLGAGGVEQPWAVAFRARTAGGSGGLPEAGGEALVTATSGFAVSGSAGGRFADRLLIGTEGAEGLGLAVLDLVASGEVRTFAPASSPLYTLSGEAIFLGQSWSDLPEAGSAWQGVAEVGLVAFRGGSSPAGYGLIRDGARLLGPLDQVILLRNEESRFEGNEPVGLSGFGFQLVMPFWIGQPLAFELSVRCIVSANFILFDDARGTAQCDAGRTLGIRGLSAVTDFAGRPLAVSSITAASGFDYGFRMVPPPAVIPEPGTWALLVAGFGLVGAASRRARRSAAIG
nr:PEPxxWA-CTERM sorting domain-containing protein [Thermaurantiacus tibetensis]